jgi:hypothetical protein
MRAVKKIGVRVVFGIGLALMAGEFVWCMVISDNS